jgi:hypothetical protein
MVISFFGLDLVTFVFGKTKTKANYAKDKAHMKIKKSTPNYSVNSNLNLN